MPPLENLDEDNINTGLPKKEDLVDSLHNKSLPSLRTYQGDVANFIKNKDQSLSKIALKNKEVQRKEEKEARKENPPPSSENRKSVSTTFIAYLLSIVLICASIFTISYIFLFKNRDNPVKIEDQKSILRVSNHFDLSFENLNKTTLEEAVSRIRGEAQYKEGITQINISGTKEISATEFVSKIGWHMPQALSRSLEPGFITGLYKGDLFIIFKVTDYGIAFRDMLSWEEYMFTDLKPLLKSSIASGSISSSTEAFVDYKFKDLIIKNKDTRAFSSPFNKVALIYTFIDNNTLLITESEGSINSLINEFLLGNTTR